MSCRAPSSQAQAQVDTLLGILHIDPAHLASFLSDSNAAMKMINAVLQGAGARGERVPQETRHAVPAGALRQGRGGRARAVVDREPRALLRGRSEGAAREERSVGQRFPAAGHQARRPVDAPAIGERSGVASVEIPNTARRGADLPGRGAGDATRRAGRAGTEAQIGGDRAARLDGGLGSALQQLASGWPPRTTRRRACSAAASRSCPTDYRRMVKDIAIQAVRNAVVHGIEPGAARGGARARPRRAWCAWSSSAPATAATS